jgi:hypothetical protein
VKKPSTVKSRPQKKLSTTTTTRRREMANALPAIQAVYYRLEANFNTLFNACTTDVQRDSLRHDYINARDTYWDAMAKIFQESDPIVIKLIEDTRAATQKIDDMLSNLQDIVGVLKVIHEAVGLASKLATLAGVPV